MKKHLILSCLFILTLINLQAQNSSDRAFIIQHTNTKVLNDILEKSNEDYFNALNKPENSKIKEFIINDKNQIGYLSGFDKEGHPVYDFDDNIYVAISSRIDKIWTGGDSELDLDGSGIEIGHWEAGGLALLTHQELDGKITHAENEAVSSHATHTACTMVGTGIDISARGMASSATIVSRRSNNDKAEIASFAADGGILSNHSYSRGNPNGNIPLYGLYSLDSENWDQILYNAPYLTICKSAGNNRNDDVNIPDNGYDLIYTIAAAKNLLTVGAVNDVGVYNGPQSVVQSSFSNWGPTDDWRIKPDLVANGVGVYSANNDNNTNYVIKSGTSMSTPAVTGAIALLQQHYHNENGVYMKSATVRALLLGTTDEAGANDGPDFQSGWGLLNAERAAGLITNNGLSTRINELYLSNGESYTTTIETDGTTPLSVTIAWTDPPGTPIFGQADNQTPMLVNDLDLRITKDATTYKPWVLTPNASSNNFTDPATKGDNYRDNLERIDIGSLPQGIYTITVSHKNNLVNGFQDFSMVISGLSESQSGLQNTEAKNSLILVYPNPSEDGFFNVSIPNEIYKEHYNIKVFDLVGKEIKNGVYSEQEVNLNLSNLNSGLFILHIQIDGKNYKQLIIIDN